MRAENLMIGDWVRIIDDDTDAYFDARIEGIDVLANIYATMPCDETAYPYSVDCAQPIPLTPEILEKNGFIKDRENEYCISYHILIPTGYEKNLYTIQITFYKVPISGVNVLFKCWGWLPPDNCGMNDIHICNVEYVHNFQHAIKLCGIEKEIQI